MNRLYQISVSEVQRFIQNHTYNGTASTQNYQTNAQNIKHHLKNIFKTFHAGAILDGDALQKLFFSTEVKRMYKVFISHSSKDADIIKQFATILEKYYKFPCFVDWMVWGNLYELQKSIDMELCLLTSNTKGGVTFNYDLRNHTTAHTHAMLSMALLDMIDTCDICIFITSENSTLPTANFADTKTLSPWIYEEITYMNHFKKNETIMMSEGGDIPPVRLSHPLDLSKFVKVTASTLIHNLRGALLS